MRKILTIAASDSGGGAGIQADNKAITLLGGFALNAVTALTAQNSLRVESVFPVPAEFVARQIDALMQDMGADAVKTGMLADARIVHTVADSLRRHKVELLIVDPVLQSSAGDRLLEETAVETLKKELLPQATVITPNLAEAGALTGLKVDSLSSMQTAARAIRSMGPSNVLVTGGHLGGDAVDLLYDGCCFTEIPGPRIDTRHTHGTGCTYSAAIAAEMAKGFPLPDAVSRAKQFVATALRFAVPVGRGPGPVNPLACIDRDAQTLQCAAELKNALHKLQGENIGWLIPEVQSNLGYALPFAACPEDVLAFPGRIIRLGETIATVAEPAAGASRHIAKIILAARRHNPEYRSAMNIAWIPAVIDDCRKLGLTVCEFSRQEEPSSVKQVEGSTLEWGTDMVIATGGTVPDIIFDRGDDGKEPMVRVLDTDPGAVADKIINIARMRNQPC